MAGIALDERQNPTSIDADWICLKKMFPAGFLPLPRPAAQVTSVAPLAEVTCPLSKDGRCRNIA